VIVFGDDGFISLMVLIIMSIILISSTYLGYTIKLENLILVSTNNEIQSYYLSEGKILMSFYDHYYEDSLYPIILKAFRNNNFKDIQEFSLEDADLGKDDSFNKVLVSFEDIDHRKSVIIKTEAEYKGRKTKMLASASLVNGLFEMNNPILSLTTVDSEVENDFSHLLASIYLEMDLNSIDIPLNTYIREVSSYEKLSLQQKEDKTYTISFERESMIEPYVENFDKGEFIIAMRRDGGLRRALILGDEIEEDMTMDLNGLIFVEGDVIVRGNLNFNGIMIVKDGEIVVNSENKPNINGIIICGSERDREIIEEKINLLYDKTYIYKYGLYLPGFLDLKVDSVKVNMKG